MSADKKNGAPDGTEILRTECDNNINISVRYWLGEGTDGGTNGLMSHHL